MKIEYSSNNSGGSWWLKDKDWIALEKAGWNVDWGSRYWCFSSYSLNKPPTYTFEKCKTKEECQGHKRFKSHKDMKESDRWLGCLAKYASKDFPSVVEALKEFEKVTGQDVMNEGCNCCGAPHSFSWEDAHCSGESCGVYLYGPKANKSKRELLEEA